MDHRLHPAVTSAAALTAIALTFAPPGLANGRFPRAQMFREHPTDSNTLFVSATYGVLVTHDRGKNWFHLCESAIHGRKLAQLDEVDPLLELGLDGTLYSGAVTALRISRDAGCDLQFSGDLPINLAAFPDGEVNGLKNPNGWVADVSLSRAKGERAIIALVASETEGEIPTFHLYQSLDSGGTWKVLGGQLPQALNLFTVDVAPSDASRIYVSGYSTSRAAAIWTSRDGGQSFQVQELQNTEEADPYIAAISPQSPDRLYLRMNRWTFNDERGGEIGDDSLYYSANAGESWQEVARARAKLLGFAVSPDGNTILAGYGDTMEAGGRHVDESVMGIYRSGFGENQLERILADLSITCLGWTKTGVYACVKDDVTEGSFGLGFAKDANFKLGDKQPLTPILRLSEVKGPLPWASGKAPNAQNDCTTDWERNDSAICKRFIACDNKLEPPHFSCVGPSGGAGGRAGGGGTGAAGNSNGGGPAKTGGSCSCGTVGMASSSVLTALSLFSVWIAARWRAVKPRKYG